MQNFGKLSKKYIIRFLAGKTKLQAIIKFHENKKRNAVSLYSTSKAQFSFLSKAA